VQALLGRESGGNALRVHLFYGGHGGATYSLGALAGSAGALD
jgi:hypothetical protein